MHLQLIFDLDQVLEQLTGLVLSLRLPKQVLRHLVVRIIHHDLLRFSLVLELALDVRLELLTLRPHHVLEVLVAHLLHSVCSGDRELPD